MGMRRGGGAAAVEEGVYQEGFTLEGNVGLSSRLGRLRALVIAALLAIPVGVAPSLAGAGAGPLITNVLPSARSNTVYLEQPLSAVIADSIPITRVVFTLTDLTSGTSRVIPNSGAAAAGTVVTVPASLTVGHLYSISIKASDALGYVQTYDQGQNPADGFLAITATSSDVLAEVTGGAPATQATILGTTQVTFAHVPVSLSKSQVTLSGTQHPGFGYVQATLPLAALEVCGTSAGTTSCVGVDSGMAADAARTRLLSLQFNTQATHVYTPVQATVEPPKSVDIGPMTTTVPSSWTGITLQAASTSLIAAFPTCSSSIDPSAFPGCASDPLRFFDSDRTASMATQEEGRLISELRAGPSAVADVALAVGPITNDSGAPCGTLSYAVSVVTRHPVRLFVSGGVPGSQPTIAPSALSGDGTATVTESIPCSASSGTYSGRVYASPCGVTDCTTTGSLFTAIVESNHSQTAGVSATNYQVAPPAQTAYPCTTTTYNIAVVTNEPVTFSNLGGPPDAITSFSPSTVSSSGAVTMTQMLACDTSPGTYNGLVEINSGVATGSSGTYEVEVPSDAVAPGVTDNLEWVWVIDTISAANMCGASAGSCPHAYRLAPTPSVPAAPAAGAASPYQAVDYGGTYPAVASFQYESLCAVGLCASPDASTAIAYNCGYCGTGRTYIYTSWFDYGQWCAPNSGPCNGRDSHMWFGTGGINVACQTSAEAKSNGAPCGAGSNIMIWGLPDENGAHDGSQDGVALSWPGNWSINFETAQTDFAAPSIAGGGCWARGGWSYNGITQAGGWSYVPSGQVTWQGQNELSFKQFNSVNIPCPNGVIEGGLTGFGVSADLFQGHFHQENGIINGAYTHSTQSTNWNWSFSCSTDGNCGIGTSPTNGTNIQTTQANPTNVTY